MSGDKNLGSFSIEQLETFLASAKRLMSLRTEIGRLPSSDLKAALTDAVREAENTLKECVSRIKPAEPLDSECQTQKDRSRNEPWLKDQGTKSCGTPPLSPSRFFVNP